MITGLFEVHLITNPECQNKLFGYITNINNPKIIRPRPTCSNSLHGDFPVQPMFTFWFSGTTVSVTDMVKDVKQDMQNNDIPIIRTKIESMAHNNGVPSEISDDHYFEFHFKIKISGTKDWNKVVNLISPYGAHLFYNPYNKSLNPTVTIRRYEPLQHLEGVYLVVKELLESEGYELTEPEKEYSLFDSNIYLDKNWLFKDTPTNFITQVSDNMLFAF